MRLFLHSWWKKLFPRAPKSRYSPNRARARFCVERLEERTVLSTFDISGGTAYYLASNGIANQVTLSQSGTLIQLTDSGETISLTNAAKLAGCTGDGTNTIDCPAAGIAAIQVNADDQQDTVTVQPRGLSAAVNIGNAVGLTNLIVDDSTDTVGRATTVTAGSVTGLGGGITYSANELSSLTINGGSGGNNITVAGTPANGNGAVSTTLNCGTGNDSVHVQATTGPLTVNGEAGIDTVFLVGTRGTLANIQGTVTVTNRIGFSNLVLVDSADTIGRTATLAAGSVTGLAPAAVDFNPGQLSSLTIIGGGGNNTFFVQDTLANPLFAANTTLDSGVGNDTVIVDGTTDPLTIDGQNGNDTVVVGAAGTLSGVRGAVTVANSGGLTNLVIIDAADSASRSARLTSSSLMGLGPAAINFNANQLSSLTIDGGGGGNSFQIQNTPSNPSFTTTVLYSGAGNDSINVQGTTGALVINGESGADSVTIGGNGSSLAKVAGAVTVTNVAGATSLLVDDSADTAGRTATLTEGSLTGLGPAAINFIESEISSLTVDGGSGGNRFLIQGTPANPFFTTTTLNSGSGNDSVDVQATSGALTIDGQNGYDGVTIGGPDETVAGIQGAVTVANSGGYTSLAVVDGADATSRSITLATGTLTGLAPAFINFNPAELSNLVVVGGYGGNTILIKDTLANPLFPANTTLDSGFGNSNITVQGTTGPLTVNGEGNADTMAIGGADGTLANIRGAVTFTNLVGASSLLVDDSSDATGRTATLTGSALTGLSPAAIRFNALTLSSLTIDGGSGGNSFVVQDTPANSTFMPTTTLNSGDGNDHVNVQGTTGPLTINGQSGADTVTIGSKAPATGGVLKNLNGTVNITNNVDLTDLNVDNSGDTTNPTPTVTASSITGLSPAAISYTAGDLRSLTINGRAFTFAEAEPNDRFAQANVIPPNSQTVGTINSPTDADFFQIQLTKAGRLNATVTPNGGSALAGRLALYGTNHQLLIESDGSPALGSNPSIVQFLAAGTYYLEVSSLSGVANYQLNSDFVPASSPLDTVNVGASPSSIVMGDFNGDGRLDMAVANQDSNTVSILLGNGDGTFQPQRTYNVGFGPDALAIGDFNRDGKIDLAVVNYNGGTVSVLLGNGDGTFQPQQSYQVGSLPDALAAADLNGDGNLDLVVANSIDNNVGVLLGNGDGTFQAMQTFATGTRATSIDTQMRGTHPSALAVGDLNGDGIRDIVVTNTANSSYATSNVGILLGNGDGTFQTMRTVAVGTEPSAVTLADINGDGELDMIVTNMGGASIDGLPSTAAGTVGVLLGNGDGSFQPMQTFAVGTQPSSATVADLNGDGKADLVVTNQSDNSISVLLGNGDGSFQPQMVYFTPGKPIAAAVTDLNGDGKPDIIAANYRLGSFSSSNAVSVLLGNGDGTFQDEQATSVGPGPVALAVADFNGDGKPDVVAAIAHNNTVSVLLGNGDGTFKQPEILPVGAGPAAVVAADLNNDGRQDLVVANSLGNTVSILLGKGDGTFRPQQTYQVGNGPNALAVGDLNGDGALDIVVVNSADDTVSVLIGKGDGSFYPQQILWAGLSGPNLVAVKLQDTRGNGKLDIVISDDAGNVNVLLGNGDGTFQPPEPFLGQSPSPPNQAIADVNGDGIPDQVSTEANNNVSVQLGNGNGTYQAPLAFPVGRQPYPIAVADLNGDGKPDMIVGNIGDNTLSVLMGNGDGSFSPATPTSGLETPDTPLLVNLTGHTDGTQDSVIIDSSGNILFRKGLSGGDDQFAPPVILNPGRPARDLAVVKTSAGFAIAATDAHFDPALSSPNHFIYTVSLYTVAANGAIVRTTAFSTPFEPGRLAAGDLNGDGLDDLAVTDPFDNRVQIAFQQPNRTFGSVKTLSTGVMPSSVTLVDVNGDGLLDVAVSDLASGDVTVLLNDPTHLFLESERFRAGPGLFGLDASTGLVGSLIEPVSLTAGDLTGNGRNDLIVVNRGSHSFSLLQNDGYGGFLNPQTVLTTSTSYTSMINNRPGPVAVGDFNHDGKLDVAILMEDTGQLWVYLNNGNGSFAPPIINPAGTFGPPTGLTFVESNVAVGPNLADRFLVGNAFGDILTLYGDGAGHFAVNRGNLNSIPFAVGHTADGRTFAVVADQSQDKLLLYYRDPNTNQFDPTPAPVDSHRLPLLAPGAVQLAQLANGQSPYLIVANQLGNNVQVYPGLPDGSFGTPVSYPVGFGPVGVAVMDFNGDGVPDLAVVNHDSNDVSILLGAIDPTTGLWTATTGPRLKSGGIGPVAVVAGDFTNNGIPALRVTNSNGQIATLPGIGSAGTGTGFFNDTNPSTVSLGTSIRQAVFDPATGEELVVTTSGGVDAVNGAQFTPIEPNGSGVTTIALVGNTLATASENGSIDLLSRDANGNFSLVSENPFEDQPISALQLLEGVNGLEVYVTRTDSDIPQILTGADFIAVTTELPQATVVAQSQSLAETDLVLVAVLLTGSSTDPAPNDNLALGSDLAFASFSPSVLFQAVTKGKVVSQGDDGDAAVVDVPLVDGDLDEQTAWEQFRTGVEEAFQRQRWLTPKETLPPQTLEFLKQIFDHVQQLKQNQSVPAPETNADLSLGADLKEVLPAPANHDDHRATDEKTSPETVEVATDVRRERQSGGLGALVMGLILLQTLRTLSDREDEKQSCVRVISKRFGQMQCIEVK